MPRLARIVAPGFPHHAGFRAASRRGRFIERLEALLSRACTSRNADSTRSKEGIKYGVPRISANVVCTTGDVAEASMDYISKVGAEEAYADKDAAVRKQGDPRRKWGHEDKANDWRDFLDQGDE